MNARGGGQQSRYFRKPLITTTFWLVVFKKSYCKVKSLLVIQEKFLSAAGQGKKHDGGRVLTIFPIIYDGRKKKLRG